MGAVSEAGMSIVDNGLGLADALVDPLGLNIGDVSDRQAAAEAQGVGEGTLTNMAALFGSQFAAFCYLVFILLYAPCVAVLGAISKEAGVRWMLVVFTWTTGLGYITASVIYQAGTFSQHPMFSGLWIAGSLTVLWLFIVNLKRIARPRQADNLIQVVQVP